MFLSNAPSCCSGSLDINFLPWCGVGCEYSNTQILKSDFILSSSPCALSTSPGELSKALYLEFTSLNQSISFISFKGLNIHVDYGTESVSIQLELEHWASARRSAECDGSSGSGGIVERTGCQQEVEHSY